MWPMRPSDGWLLRSRAASLALGLACLSVPSSAAEGPAAMASIVDLSIYPAQIVLDGRDVGQTVVVMAEDAHGVEWDLTDRAALRLRDPDLARLDEGQALVLRGVEDGATRLTASYGGLSTQATVRVGNAGLSRELSFVRDVVPLMTRGGCAGSNCHGSVRGKNGFKLSLFGFEPEADYQAITVINEGRRVDLEAPEKSLLLLKPTFSIPHGGGVRFEVGSRDYSLLLEWLKQRAPYEQEQSPTITSLEVFPEERILVGENSRQQLVVTATYSDGSREDATRKAQYSSGNEDVVAVKDGGGLTAAGPGETAVMVRMLGKAVAVRVAVVADPPMAEYPAAPVRNFIDELVFSKLRKLNIIPSRLSSDEKFLRRVYLDAVGVLPTVDEAREFLTSSNAGKRAKLIDRLLERPEFNDVWAMNFNQVFRVRGGSMAQGVRRGHRWIREALASHKPYDRMVREMVTGQGTLYWDGEAKFYAIGSQNEPPETFAVNVSQTLLGVRLECSKCHNHPFERWSQDDFYGFSAFFTRLRQKEVYQANEMTIFLKQEGEVLHPKTKKPVAPKFLDGPVVEVAPGEDVREQLAEWITDRRNPWFARALVNRVWKHYTGRGFVEPVDDFRVTNPPSNLALLDALADHFVEHEFRIRELVRVILNSRTYQLSSQANETNRGDSINYSRYYIKRLDAEQLADAVSRATGVPENYGAYAPGTRAMEIPEGSPSYFLRVLGRSEAGEAIRERDLQIDLAQALHLINGNTIHEKVKSPEGALEKWLQDESISDGELLRRVYLSTLSRFPKADEASYVEQLFASDGAQRREVFEDIYWSIFNSNEFFFNH